MMQCVAALAMAVMAVQNVPVNPKAAALDDFSKRLDAYLELREALGKKLGPLSQTADPTELAARQKTLAVELSHARAQAKPGDLVPAAVQEQIRATVHADYARRTPATKRATLEEVPTGPLPGINKTYPEQAALPTVPPLLLASLPRLPDNLQYRFFGRHVVILDGDVDIVLDYVHDCVPR